MEYSKTENDAAAESEMRRRLELLTDGFTAFREKYKLPLHVKDFTGYMGSHPLLGEFTETSLYHDNAFCSYVKSFPEAREKCIITSNELMRRRLTAQIEEVNRSLPTHRRTLSYGFYGVCWCGVREYVYPVCHNGVVIGALLAGAFRADQRCLTHSFSRLCNNWGLDELCLRQSYDSSTEPLTKERTGFELSVALLAEYLSMLAEYYIKYPLIVAYRENGEHSDRHRMINLAIDYISQNLSRKISAADMAVYCMCSKSTLNHTFSGVMGRSIPEYVSIQRVNRAKYLLMNTTLSIEQIGTQCGFMSAAYFSVVFKKLTELTPSEYRERMLGRRNEDISGLI